MEHPTLSEEETLWRQGVIRVAGVDEAGRGPLAGPVVAAAVILPRGLEAGWTGQVADSKLLTAARRERLFERIKEAAISVGTGMIDSRTIDTVGIARASRLAMKAAIEQLEPGAEFLLIDYFRLPEVRLPQKGVPEGDTACFSIACASIIAKVSRDRIMRELDAIYPGYGFAENKGYSTRDHLENLRRLGPCPLHRTTFQPVRHACEAGL